LSSRHEFGPVAGVDFFRYGALPAPLVSREEAERIAAAQFGLAAHAWPLGSQQDSNFLLVAEGAVHDGGLPAAPDRGVLGVLKIANPVFTAAEIEAQDAAAEHIAATVGWLRVGAAVAGPVTVRTDGGPAIARVLRYLPGGTLTGQGYLAPQVVAGIGTVAGEVSRALRYFTHPGLDRVLQWDLRYADRLIERLAGHVRDNRLRALIQDQAGESWQRVQQLAGQLPRQAVHCDVTDDNVVCTTRNGIRSPDGVIDFGDLTTTWAVCELAVAITSVLHHAGAEPCSTRPAVRSFHRLRPLSRPEATALWPLVVLRAAVLVVSGEQQAAIDVSNTYVTAALEQERRVFEQAISVPTDVMTGLINDELGFGHAPLRVPAGAALLRGLDPARCQVLDTSSQSDATDEGAWLEAGLTDRLAEAGLAEGAQAVVTRFAEPRLAAAGALAEVSPATVAAGALAEVSPATVATGVDLWLGHAAELTAPWPGVVTGSAPGRLVLDGSGLVLTLSWREPTAQAERAPGASVPGELVHGELVPGGGALVRLAAGSRLQVNLRTASAPPMPSLVRPEYAAGWLSLAADPAPLLGLPPAPREPDDDLLSRRDTSFAAVQEHYYPDPPRIERGWRHYLAATDGRVYLDMVNNVAVLGHSHPRLEAAVSRQLRRLNTNSRFNYASVVEFAERLAALLPGPLEVVFGVNSGSEAVDLAIRLALVTTGHRDVVAVREAYHGWTYASDAISTSTADNPNALSTRPRWVHTVDAPNSYRGRYRGPDAGRYAQEAARLITELAASGRPPAAFVAEPFYGNTGGMALPDGYLAETYAAVRHHGGLAIADEIQVGYGRLGHWFWGFEQQGVVPDIVTMAKAIGNGHPLGAVVTSHAIAERYRDEGYFFSSTGGSPVSSVIGLTVLDVIRDEGLQANAARVGAHLKARLTGLAERHELIGAVHGSGLYLGVEFVRDRATLEPATAETMAICDRMLELGVIIQPTGDRMCVLKIKPPLCLDIDGADFFADTLDRVLREGW
jgi:4-aminobutyrate aminotransferase-like enzyme/Ser/Thr protein kinase RdoA (MazF antagonist)